MIFTYKRLKYLVKLLCPFVMVYLVYFLTLDLYVFPSSRRVFGERVKVEYNKTRIPGEVDYLVLGDSAGWFAINPMILGPNSYNASNGGATLFRAHQTLTALHNIKINGAIFLTQTFISAHYNEDIWDILVPGKLLSLKEIFLHFCDKENVQCGFLEKFFISFKFVLARSHLTAISFKAITSVPQLLKNGTPQSIHLLREFEERHGHYNSPSPKKLSDAEFLLPYRQYFNHESFSFPNSEFYYLNEIIKIAKERKVKIYFVICPMLESFKNSDATAYRNSLWKILDRFKGSGMKIIDGHSFQSSLDKSDYADYNHLNEKGATKFSEYLLQMIKKDL